VGEVLRVPSAQEFLQFLQRLDQDYPGFAGAPDLIDAILNFINPWNEGIAMVCLDGRSRGHPRENRSLGSVMSKITLHMANKMANKSYGKARQSSER